MFEIIKQFFVQSNVPNNYQTILMAREMLQLGFRIVKTLEMEIHFEH